MRSVDTSSLAFWGVRCKPPTVSIPFLSQSRCGLDCQMPEKLPVFDRPPVVEAMLGLRFEPVDELNMPYLGLYWESIRKQYPSTEIKAPITEGIPGAPLVEIVSTPKIRCWFIDESSSRLIQVQQDRFYYNWRKMPDSQEYPHYSPDLREKFGSEWVRFSDFLARQELPKPNVLSCEITYINHIERGEGWNDYSDLPKVFSSLAPGNSRVLA